METIYIVSNGDFAGRKLLKGVKIKDNAIWAKTSKGWLPMCSSVLLADKGLDAKQVASSGSALQHCDCWLKMGQNPGTVVVYTKSQYLDALDAAERANMPAGVLEIRAAHDRLVRAQAQYSVAQRQEGWASYPSSYEYDALVAAYPRAALYEECEDYINSLNGLKATAGQQAKKLLVEGGTVAEVKAVLANWLPESAAFY
jgi:hypothetical protein